MALITVKQAIYLKEGMTRIFDSEGCSQPVTVLRVLDTRVARVVTSKTNSLKIQLYASKKNKKDGVELVATDIKELNKKINKSNIITYELQLPKGLDSNEVKFNDEVELEIKDGANIDVTSISKGKGFQGVIKRHGFAGGPASHGSQFHRRSGSIGNRATPARVFAQKKMPGRMGCDKITVKNLKILGSSKDHGYILVRGAVPGHRGTEVLVKIK